VRHRRTVVRLVPSRAATAVLFSPSAHASTMRARFARPCAVVRRLAQLCNVSRSLSDNTSGSSLVSPMPPAQRTKTIRHRQAQDLKQNTTHVATRKLRTGSLDGLVRMFIRGTLSYRFTLAADAPAAFAL
jgi:hypothetical protein